MIKLSISSGKFILLSLQENSFTDKALVSLCYVAKALCVLCWLKEDVSTPVSSINCFINHSKVLADTDLFGCM